MNNDVISFLMNYGVGCRDPKDNFFNEGTEASGILKTYGVFEVDDEDLLHRPFQEFSCHVPGCTACFESVLQYDQHYNSCHRFSCSQCNKNLPSSHLLDLHLMETHDAFFAAQAEKKPMFQCYLEECKSIFKNGQERRDHCISFHKFPSDFRFDEARKKSPNKNLKGKSNNNKGKGKLREGTVSDENFMEVEEAHSSNKPNEAKSKKKEQTKFRGRRKPILSTFCKDLKDSLPQSPQ